MKTLILVAVAVITLGILDRPSQSSTQSSEEQEKPEIAKRVGKYLDDNFTEKSGGFVPTWYKNIIGVSVRGKTVIAKTDLSSTLENDHAAEGVCKGVSWFVFGIENRSLDLNNVQVHGRDGQVLINRKGIGEQCVPARREGKTGSVVERLRLIGLPEISRLLPSLIPATLGALAVLGVVIAVKVGRRRDSQRQAALALVAAELGMGFTPEDNALLSQFGGFAFIPHRNWSQATSVMRGTIQGTPVVLFDYYVTWGGLGSDIKTVRLTVAAFDLASKSLPVFEAEGGQNNWVIRLLGRNSGDKVIDFPDDPDFTRGFCVTGDDAQAVRRLLSPDARSSLTRRTDWRFRSNGRWLLMCRHKRPKPGDYRAFVEEASEVMLVMTGARV